MKVLIGGFDLFDSVGGGQTYYRNLILRHPQIEFHYFRQHESSQIAIPANARALEYRQMYAADSFDPRVPPWLNGPFIDAHNLARNVAGNQYDVIDIPDYYYFGAFLRPALKRYDVAAERIVLSMHGAISTSLAMNWGADGQPDLQLRQIERMQYDVADLRYFISEFYRDEWRGYSPLPSQYLDPMWFFDVPTPRPYRPECDRPVLRFVGRVEKRKGPHLFIETAWWLPRTSYASAEIIGPDCAGANGKPASAEVGDLIRRRGLDIRLLKSHSSEELARVFSSCSVVFAPSIYDTLNLVALESLFSGCPTVVGRKAGVCRYLEERFPTIPFLAFDTDRFLENVPRVAALLADYDRQRQALAAAVQGLDTRPIGPGLMDIYRGRAASERGAVERARDWHESLARLLPDLAVSNRPSLRRRTARAA